LRKAALAIFCLGLIPRLIASYLGSGTLLQIPFVANFAILLDWRYYYVPWAQHFLQGMLPYSGFAYSYLPLFLVWTAGFQALGFLPLLMVITGAGSSVMVYLIARVWTSERIARYSAIAYALSPYFLIYEGYAPVSEQPLTFLFLAGIALSVQGRAKEGYLSYALAMFTKQNAFGFLPAVIVDILRNKGKRGLLRFAGVVCLVAFIVSIPFLILEPGPYLYVLTVGRIGAPGLGGVVPVGNSSSFSSPDTFTLSGLTYTVYQAPFIDRLAQLLNGPLLLLFVFPIVMMRKTKSYFAISGAATFVVLTAFADYIGALNGIFQFRFIASYALLSAAAWDMTSLVFICGFPIVSLFLPPGPDQLLSPTLQVVAIFFLWLIQESKRPAQVGLRSLFVLASDANQEETRGIE
jgi:hypothetical protein